MSTRDTITRADLAAAAAELDAAAAAVPDSRLLADHSDHVGCPGVRLRSAPETAAEERLDAARAEYIRAARARHSYVRGPVLRDYYAREES